MVSRQTRKVSSAGSAEQEAVLSVLHAATLIRRRFELLCSRHHLTFKQYLVLRILGGARKSGEGPLPTMEVAARLIEPEPGISRMMDRLEHKGLVRRKRSAKDARLLLCGVTRKAIAALARLDEPMADLHRTALSPLSEKERLTVNGLLKRIRETED